MLINNKRFLLTMLVIVLPSLQLLNIQNINSKSKDKKLHQSNVKADIAETSQTRHVAKFKSMKRDLASKNGFQNMQNKNQTANTSVFLSNKASFKYQVGYSNYNVYGAKNSDFHATVAKNTTNRMVNIGTNSILAITVKVTAPGQKWASLVLTNTFTPTKDMIPASIHYLILGSKTINDANISLNVIYKNRIDPMTPKTVAIGFFNVNNINANVGTVLSGGAIGGIIIGCVVTAIGIAITLHAALLDLWEWKARKSATSGIDAIMTTAADKEKLTAIRYGTDETYGKGKIFPESSEAFIAETDAMIETADRAGLIGNLDRQFTAQENFALKRDVQKNKIIIARDTIAKARRNWLEQKAEASSVLEQELKPKGNQGTTTLDRSLYGSSNKEKALPVSPIKQTGGDQEQALIKKRENEEKERITALAKEKKEKIQQEIVNKETKRTFAIEKEENKNIRQERDNEGQDNLDKILADAELPSANGAAETGESKTILPKEGQEANVLDDIGGSLAGLNWELKGSTPFPNSWVGEGQKGTMSCLVGSEQNVRLVDTLRWLNNRVDVYNMSLDDVNSFLDATGLNLYLTPLYKDESSVEGGTRIFFFN